MEMKNITLAACERAFTSSAKECLVDLRLAADGNYSIFKHKRDS